MSTHKDRHARYTTAAHQETEDRARRPVTLTLDVGDALLVGVGLNQLLHESLWEPWHPALLTIAQHIVAALNAVDPRLGEGVVQG